MIHAEPYQIDAPRLRSRFHAATSRCMRREYLQPFVVSLSNHKSPTLTCASFRALRLASLQTPQRRIDTVAQDELVVRSGFDDPARFQHVDRIGVAHG